MYFCTSKLVSLLCGDLMCAPFVMEVRWTGQLAVNVDVNCHRLTVQRSETDSWLLMSMSTVID